MDKLKIFGKSDLSGSIEIPGAKNAALPIMISSMLSKEELHLRNIPNLFDITSMKELLLKFGLQIFENGKSTIFNGKDINNRVADCIYEGHKIAAFVKNKNICGCQFHPEKSGKLGLKVLKEFIR